MSDFNLILKGHHTTISRNTPCSGNTVILFSWKRERNHLEVLQHNEKHWSRKLIIKIEEVVNQVEISLGTSFMYT
jgi:hypothetical protein